MKRILIYAFIGFLMLSNGACSNSKKKGQDVTDSTQKKQGVGTGKILAGELAVIVDESILPIMLEQADVFKTSYENANIRLIPKDITVISAERTSLKCCTQT